MTATVSSFLSRTFRAYQIFGANTDVGKTIISTIICRAELQNGTKPSTKIWYLKPVSTGSADEADIKHLKQYARGTTTQNIYQFDEAVSPHIAAAKKKACISDSDLLQRVYNQILDNAKEGSGFMLVETAGGSHSPGPSRSSQADIYRPLRLPTLFVADYRLGGISTSISSYESLKIRGYDVDGVAVFRDEFYRNFEYFQEYFGDRDIPLLVVQPPPEKHVVRKDDEVAMLKYYDDLQRDGDTTSPAVFMSSLSQSHTNRIRQLETLASTAQKHIWYPFTQHTSVTADRLTVIDSAHGDYFQTLRPLDSEVTNRLRSTVDASASWWTQGVGHSNPSLTMAAATAAGRYGHVMFASAIHEPAMSLATNLLSILGNPRLNRVFYSDNGSTGMEVAIKMALVATGRKYGWSDAEYQKSEILGFKNSYHGDTLGTVDMAEPSVFNQKIPWYKGRGYWFDPPSVKMNDGKWVIEDLLGEEPYRTEFTSLAKIFDPKRDQNDDLALRYKGIIERTLERLVQHEKRRFGALVMEPVILGAGGMILVDPLFQRTLINVVRSSPQLFASSSSPAQISSSANEWTGLPFVADEVFTGLYRLGYASSSRSLLHVDPDIAVHAKLLTGGLLPLATTLASEAVFNAFLGDSKADALLHGHSYTAHAVGCAVGVESLRLLQKYNSDGSWDCFRGAWNEVEAPSPSSDMSKEIEPWAVWRPSFLYDLSVMKRKVESVWALGSVLAISLRDMSGASGYASNAAASLQRLLIDGTNVGWNIHSRVLGNVLYLMTSQVCTESDVRKWEERVLDSINKL